MGVNLSCYTGIYSLRCILSRIRFSSHSLRIQTGRYAQNRLARNERVCLYCDSGDIEDEFHFICVCRCFDDLRKQYLKKYYINRPSMFKFTELMKCSSKTVLRNLCKYVKEALSIRHSQNMIN